MPDLRRARGRAKTTRRRRRRRVQRPGAAGAGRLLRARPRVVARRNGARRLRSPFISGAAGREASSRLRRRRPLQATGPGRPVLRGRRLRSLSGRVLALRAAACGFRIASTDALCGRAVPGRCGTAVVGGAPTCSASLRRGAVGAPVASDDGEHGRQQRAARISRAGPRRRSRASRSGRLGEGGGFHVDDLSEPDPRSRLLSWGTACPSRGRGLSVKVAVRRWPTVALREVASPGRWSLPDSISLVRIGRNGRSAAGEGHRTPAGAVRQAR